MGKTVVINEKSSEKRKERSFYGVTSEYGDQKALLLVLPKKKEEKKRETSVIWNSSYSMQLIWEKVVINANGEASVLLSPPQKQLLMYKKDNYNYTSTLIVQLHDDRGVRALTINGTIC